MKKLLITAIIMAVTGLSAICQDSKSLQVSMKMISGDFCTDQLSRVTVLITNRGSAPVLIDVASIGRSGRYRKNGNWVEFDNFPKLPSELQRIGSGERREVEARFNLIFSTFTSGVMRLSLEALVFQANADPESKKMQTLIRTNRASVRFRSCDSQVKK